MIDSLSITGAPALKFGGEWRVLNGCFKETEETKAQFPSFEETFRGVTPLDPSQWQEIDLSRGLPILNQGSTNACVGFSATSAMQLAWVQSGRSLIDFQPFFVYALINGGRDAGAYISNALKVLMQHGVCEKSVLPSNRVLYTNGLTKAAYDNAAKYKLIKAFRCDNFNQICSAITMGFPVVYGIDVGGNFDNLDSEGVAPLPNYVRGGHALCGVGLKKSSRYGWIVKTQNSWNGWGINNSGFCYLQKGALDRNPDAFALQVVSEN